MTTTTASSSSSSSSPSLDLDTYLKSLNSKSSSTSSSSKTSGSSTLDKNSFMQLMVTQLQYQDPLNPSDNQQMAAQMAQFSQLEALQNMQTSMAGLASSFTEASSKQVAATEASATASATSLLGQTAKLKRETVTYSGTSLSMSVNATKGSEVAILDSKGDVVRTIQIDSSSLDSNGDGTVTWDGTDDDGKAAGSGTYSVSVRDQASGATTGYAFEKAKITGVGSGTDGTVLKTENGTYDLADLLQVDSSSSSSSTSSSSGGSSNAAAAIALIGHEVRVRDASGTLSDEGSGVDWKFSAQSGAKGEILDSSGNVVRTFSVSGTGDDGQTILASDGTGKFHWDGLDDSGTLQEDGTYYLQIVSADGKSSAGTPYQSVKVDQVGFDTSGNPILMSGNSAWSFQNLYTVV